MAIFPGSFDPFPQGHAILVARVLNLFDAVVVAVGVNSDKNYMFSAQQRVEAIQQRYKEDSRVRVVAFSDMTVDCCRREGAGVIVRGVRNAQDMQYEQTVAAGNHRLAPEIETVLLLADPELVDVSSTLEREKLMHKTPTP